VKEILKKIKKQEFIDKILREEFGEILHTVAVQEGSLKWLREKVEWQAGEVWKFIRRFKLFICIDED